MEDIVIFGVDIEKILSEKLKSFILKADFIKSEDYKRLREILKSSSDYDYVTIDCSIKSEEEFLDFFAQTIMSNGEEFAIDKSKIRLSGQILNYNCDIFKNIENIVISPERIKDIDVLKLKFPNLKNIEINRRPILKNESKDNLMNIIKVAQFSKSIEMVPYYSVEEIRNTIKEAGFENTLFISDDGVSIINKDKIINQSSKTGSLRVNVHDISEIGLDRLIASGDEIVLVIKDASELSVEKIREYQEAGLNIDRIRIFQKENEIFANKPYEVEKYCLIREKLEKLVQGIDVNLPEKEKFAEVYRRVCKYIAYDTIAGYPKTKDEEAYSKSEECNSRNLVNGLLKGKCVCSGYSEILRNALAMVGIESKIASGIVITREVKKEKFNKDKLKFSRVYKEEQDRVILGEDHAWNKVRIDGVWYNVDATWDSKRIREGLKLVNCLKTDKEITERDKKVGFGGPDCTEHVKQIEVDKLFDKEHLYIGNYAIPNFKDIILLMRDVVGMYKHAGIIIANGVSSCIKHIKDLIRNSSKNEPILSIKSNTDNNSKECFLDEIRVERRKYSSYRKCWKKSN